MNPALITLVVVAVVGLLYVDGANVDNSIFWGEDEMGHNTSSFRRDRQRVFEQKSPEINIIGFQEVHVPVNLNKKTKITIFDGATLRILKGGYILKNIEIRAGGTLRLDQFADVVVEKMTNYGKIDIESGLLTVTGTFTQLRVGDFNPGTKCHRGSLILAKGSEVHIHHGVFYFPEVNSLQGRISEESTLHCGKEVLIRSRRAGS